jgi:hypothetical protein
MTKVIFLDIDGVMNSELFYRKRHRMRWLKPSHYLWWIPYIIKYKVFRCEQKAVSLVGYEIPDKHKTFKYLFNRLKKETDPAKWKMLIQLCKDTDAHICISSVWKHHFHDDIMANRMGWRRALIQLGFPLGSFVGITGNRQTLRGDEINDWIDCHTAIEKYAIIDDDSDMLPEQLPNFFQCDGYIGLTPTICYRIKNHFNAK